MKKSPWKKKECDSCGEKFKPAYAHQTDCFGCEDPLDFQPPDDTPCLDPMMDHANKVNQ